MARRPGRPRRVRLALAAVVLFAPAAARAAAVEIAIAAPGPCPPALRQRIAEQIAGVADPVTWSCRPRFDADEPFNSTAGGQDLLQIWVDLTPGREARLTLRAGRADRFVLRRIPLPRGLDEIAREEIGQIVRSAAIAVLGGPGQTLGRAQARTEISRWTRPAAPAPPAPRSRVPPPPAGAGRSSLGFEVGALASVRAFSTGIPVVGEVGLGLALDGPGPLRPWIEGAYQIPARDLSSPVGVELDAVAARAGLAAAVAMSRSVALLVGAGAGLARTSFTPRVEDPTVTARAAGAFWSPTGRIVAGVAIRAGAHLALRLTAFCDVVGADVHYDLVDAGGTTRRPVLVPFRVQPGLAVQIGWIR